MERWLYRQYRRNLHRTISTRPSRAHPIEAPAIWAAHLIAWTITVVEQIRGRSGSEQQQVRQPTPQER